MIHFGIVFCARMIAKFWPLNRARTTDQAGASGGRRVNKYHFVDKRLSRDIVSGAAHIPPYVQSGCRRRKAVTSFLAAVCLVLVMASGKMFAQSFYGSIVGTVSDASGGVVADATVTVTNLGTSEVHTVKTNASGEYTVVNLVPARYKVEITRDNFKKFSRPDLQVEVGSALRIDAALPVGAVTETVEVTSQAPLLDTEASGMSQTIEGVQVQETPLNGRNIMSMITLAPGVVAQGSTAGGAAMSQHGDHTSNQAWNNYQVGGAISGESASYVDGAPTNVLGQNLVGLLVTQDAVQEFSVSSSNANSDFGRYGGGVINMTTRSGGNALHGTIYEYIRNTDFNANDYFSNQQGSPRGKYNQNQFGVNVTGPIKKDRVFFMGGWEGFHSVIGLPAQSTVPTTNLQNGLFSQPLYNLSATATSGPTATVTDAGTGCVIDGPAAAGNPNPGYWTITNLKTCGDPTSAVLKTFYPAPNVTAPGAGYNFFFQPKQYDDQNQYNGRIDWSVSPNQRAFARYTYWQINDTGFDTFNSYNGFPTENAYSVNYSQQAVVGDTYTFNAKTVLDVRLDWMREYYPNLPENQNVNEGQFGPQYANLAALESIHVIPVYGLTGRYSFTGFNSSTTFSQTYYNDYVISANLTRLQGKHSLKFGMEARLMDNNGTGQNSQLGSSSSFTNALTGDEWANFLLGYYTTDAISTFNSTTAYNYYQAYYATDTWQPRHNLTVDLGLRYELPGAIAEKHDKATVLLPNATDPYTGITGTLALVNSPAYPHRPTVLPEYKLFAPHAGFVYRIGLNAAIRGGYGIAYLPPDIQGNSPGILPNTSPVNQGTKTLTNTFPGTVATTNAAGTGAYYKLSNPFPNGSGGQAINTPLGRSNPAFMTNFYNQPIYGAVPFQSYPYTQQYNLEISEQFKGNWLLDVGYAGSKGTHIPGIGTTTYVGQNLNALPDVYDSMGAALATPGTCAAAATIKAQTGATITQGQCLQPYPYYKNVVDLADYKAFYNYNSLQVKLTKRFGNAGELLANYTFGKQMGNTDNSIGALETKATSTTRGGGYGQIQDFNNPAAEYSILSYNVPHRVVISYVYNLPFGHGQKYGSNLSGIVDAFVGGWQASGITTFQSGFPLKITEGTASPLETNYVGGILRPSVVPGCKKQAPGTALQRVKAGAWFNTSCFYYPGQYSFGNEARVDPTLYSEGIDNFDFALEKGAHLLERFDLKFRAEVFNLFNRVQFSPPVVSSSNPATNTSGPGVQTATSQFGQVLSQANQPREIQFSLRLNY